MIDLQEGSNNSKSNQKHADNPTSINKIQIKSKIETLLLNGDIIDDDPKNLIAVYRDKNDQIHTFSAKCIHSSSILPCKPLETSIDCPCHGSRFYNNGKVINGPANINYWCQILNRIFELF